MLWCSPWLMFLKGAQRMRSVALTTVNINAAICRGMWVLLQNDEALQECSELETDSQERNESVQLNLMYPLWWTFNILSIKLYVMAFAFFFLIHPLHFSRQTVGTLRCIFRWWHTSNTGTGKRLCYICRTYDAVTVFGVARRIGSSFMLNALTQQWTYNSWPRGQSHCYTYLDIWALTKMLFLDEYKDIYVLNVSRHKWKHEFYLLIKQI